MSLPHCQTRADRAGLADLGARLVDPLGQLAHEEGLQAATARGGVRGASDPVQGPRRERHPPRGCQGMQFATIPYYLVNFEIDLRN